MLLYHGSHENTSSIHVHAIEDVAWEIFDGIFASPSSDAALSHGPYLYSIEIPPESVLKSGIVIELDSEPNLEHGITIDDVFADIIVDYNPEDWEIWYDALVLEDYDRTDPIWLTLLGISDPAEIGWDLQNLRGRLAAALGYRAAEMHDEHGISYFLVPGNVLTRVDEETNA